MAGQTEVDDHDAPVFRHQHVRGFQIAMQHAVLVQRAHTREQPLPSMPHASQIRVTRGLPLPAPGREVHAGHELHGQVPTVVIARQLVEPDQVRMRDPRQAAELPLEAVQLLGIRTLECFQRDAPALGGPRLIHDPHGALAQPPPASEAPDGRKRRPQPTDELARDSHSEETVVEGLARENRPGSRRDLGPPGASRA